MVSEEYGFFIDPQRCIGCRSCVAPIAAIP